MLYTIVRFYVKIGLHLFYKKIEVVGLENIPKKGAVLFVANHQNAMMDPILIGTNNPRILYFLARASAFKNKIAGKLLNEINAIAIYRVRDGVDSKKRNEAVFKKCTNLLNKNKSILIFPEGSHDKVRRVRSLRAGFTRITIDYLLNNPDKEFYIIPVGINYSNTVNYAKEVKIIYGKPILASKLFNKENLDKSRSILLVEVHQKLKEITVHIEEENYETILASLTEKDFLTPKITNSKLKTLKPQTPNSKPQTQNLKPQTQNIFYYIMMVNSFIPFLVWKWLKPKIKATEFISTAKFSLGLTIFPIVYFLQTLLVNHFFGNTVALIYVVFCFLIIILSSKTRQSV